MITRCGFRVCGNITVYVKQVSQDRLHTPAVYTYVGQPNQVLAIAETGQFKIGDGVTPWKDLPWADRLPVLVVDETGTTANQPKSEKSLWQKITGIFRALVRR